MGFVTAIFELTVAGAISLTRMLSRSESIWTVVPSLPSFNVQGLGILPPPPLLIFDDLHVIFWSLVELGRSRDRSRSWPTCKCRLAARRYKAADSHDNAEVV